MHLARRSYLLVMLTAVIAIAGIWSTDQLLVRLWHVPAALLLLGLAAEGLAMRHLQSWLEAPADATTRELTLARARALGAER